MNKLIFLTALIAVLPFITSHPFDAFGSDEENEATEHLYDGQREFFISLLNGLQKAGKSKGNVLFSPHSIYHALLLAYVGSAGETEQSLKRSLNLEWADSKADVIQAYKQIKALRNERSEGDGVEFNSVDKFYITNKAELT